MSFAPPSPLLQHCYGLLLATYGPQRWWPADTPFEVVVGAVLTQNTAWRNVERALERVRAARKLDCQRVAMLPLGELAELIRPAGFYNLKARRLQNLSRAILDAGGMEALAALGTEELRRLLLQVDGVGPETADDILLYAFDRPVFVIDAYTRRLLARLGLARGDEAYEVLRAGLERALGSEPMLFNEYHALIVQHAKMHCRVRPNCSGCCLAGTCAQSGVAPQ
jgi:endonuclease-3 related protein